MHRIVCCILGEYTSRVSAKIFGFLHSVKWLWKKTNTMSKTISEYVHFEENAVMPIICALFEIGFDVYSIDTFEGRYVIRMTEDCSKIKEL